MLWERKKYYTERGVRKKGKYDGRSWRWRFGWPLREEKDPVPSSDNETSPFERQLIMDAEADLQRLVQTWKEMDKELYNKCVVAAERYKNAKDKFESAKKKKEKEVGEYEGGEDSALKQYIDVKKEFEEYPKPHLNSFIGFVLIVIMTIGEGFFNLLVFNIFGQSRLETLLMAIATMVAIPVCGYIVGKKLKLKTRKKSDIVLMIISSFIVIIGLGTLAFFREEFLKAVGVEKITGIKMSPFIMGLSFFIINLLIFIAIIAIEYERAFEDPDEYKRKKKALERAKEKLEKEKKEAIDAIEEFESAQKEVEEAREALKTAINLRKNAFDRVKTKALERRKRWVSLILAYRDANLSVRKGGHRPAILMNKFDENDIKLPSELENLDWENLEKEIEEILNLSPNKL